MRLERRAEEPKNGAREGTETVQRDQNREEQQLRQPPRRVSKAEAVKPWRAEGDELATPPANLPTESDVRELDGTSCDAGELRESTGGGKTQRWCAGDRRDACGGTRETPGNPLGKDPGEVAGGDLY